jgi:hypothetical protein
MSLRAFTNVEPKNSVWEYHEFNPTLFVDLAKDVKNSPTIGITLFRYYDVIVADLLLLPLICMLEQS